MKELINKIHCMDCIEGMKLIPDNSIDCVITDPPYEFVLKNPKGGGFMAKENKKHIDEINESFGMTFNPIMFLNEIKRLLKKFNLYVFTNKSLLKNYIEFAENNNYKWDILIWKKPNPVPINNGHYLIDKEYIMYIKESGATFNSKLGYDKYFTFKSHPIGIKKFNHPTIKPIKLITNPIKISTNKDDIILDPFIGSGTTAVACKELNRNFIGFEVNPEYVKIANKRLKQKSIYHFL